MRLVVLAVLTGLAAGPAAAVGPELDEAGSAQLDRAGVLIDAGAYDGAIRLLERVRRRTGDSADLFNLLGFAHRQRGDTQAALNFYLRALAIDPRHLGANEYLGELYLQLGEVNKARQRLAVLAAACNGCGEFRELAEAIAAHAGS